MQTQPQREAVIITPQSATGPRTEAGKAISSKNAVKLGLFAADFIRPGEEAEYESLSTGLNAELAPKGIVEQTLADEIRRAMWRLRRCGNVEARLADLLCEYEGHCLDPMEDESLAGRIQKSVDRARSQAHRLLHKCTAELRRAQAERKLAVMPAPSDPAVAASPEHFAKRTRPEFAAIPRNARCTCGSGLKFKRCCGENAPPVLNAA